MSRYTEIMNKRLFPLFFISAIIIALYIIAGNHSNSPLSEEPLILHHNPPQIVMFGTPECPYCQLARQFFDKHHLPYIEHDIEASDEQRKIFDLLGGRGTPLLIINKQLIQGFDEDEMRKAL